MCLQFSETLQHPSLPILITGSCKPHRACVGHRDRPRGALPVRTYACCASIIVRRGQVDYGECEPYYSGAELSASMRSRKSYEWWLSPENPSYHSNGL
ncbi:hypothetical protein M405DRAFT_835021 [Rhizopogon salebrosus TDB-379]|nr:hypothetical protein M405DRAFT_835021 [Rhizopogon salebrosus TDB-379]